MVRRYLVFLGMGGALFFGDRPAWALELTPKLRAESGARAEAELALTSDSDEHSSQWTLSPLFRAGYFLADEWDVEAELGFAQIYAAPDEGDSSSRAVLSNLVVSGGWQHEAPEYGFVTVRLALAAPTASVPPPGTDRALARAAYGFALASRGLWDAWRWAPEQAGAAVQAGFMQEQKYRLRVLLASEGGLGLTVPVSDSAGSSQLVGQLAAEALFGKKVLVFGPRLQGVLMPLAESSSFQVSGGLSALVALGSNAMLKAQLLANIDHPLARGLGVWGLKLSGGASW